MLNRSGLFRYELLLGFGGVAERLPPQSEFASLSGRGNRFYDEDKDTGYGTNWSFAKVFRCSGLKSPGGARDSAGQVLASRRRL